jgi:hypothetical protein
MTHDLNLSHHRLHEEFPHELKKDHYSWKQNIKKKTI